ncbi:MAG: elongation factor P [Clostridia bacterium]|nr:elongation factor P [Clostridia bacterium]
MIFAGDFRKGTTFVMDDKLYIVVEFQHVKPGKGAAFVHTKIKNIVTGSVLERNFNPSEKYEKARIETKEMTYSYSADGLVYFMDNETYELIPLNEDKVGDTLKYITENMPATIKFYKGDAFSVEPPNFVELLITKCDPGAVGNTATNVTKPATLETGYELYVPMFVNEGDTIRIDTRTGEYMERIKK